MSNESLSQSPHHRQLVIDTDVGIDDLAALAALLSPPNQQLLTSNGLAKLRAVCAVRGLLDPKTGARHVHRVLNCFCNDAHQVSVASPNAHHQHDCAHVVGGNAAPRSENSDARTFPVDWCAAADEAVSSLLAELEARAPSSSPLGGMGTGVAKKFERGEEVGCTESVEDVLEQALFDGDTILCLGPLTNVARVLTKASVREQLATKSRSRGSRLPNLVWSGGAFEKHISGCENLAQWRVHEECINNNNITNAISVSNEVVEWNAFIDSKAAFDVLVTCRVQFENVTLVPLNASAQFNPTLLLQLFRQPQHQQQHDHCCCAPHQLLESIYRTHVTRDSRVPVFDLAAAAYLIAPHAFLTTRAAVTVNKSSGATSTTTAQHNNTLTCDIVLAIREDGQHHRAALATALSTQCNAAVTPRTWC
mmetsp:Transcript_15609/g.33667  ORF Transcript_15609/g.33667 Transcript_15609/m.33667 type:complete len:421 (+) Transcript_15609:380-1642(+)